MMLRDKMIWQNGLGGEDFFGRAKGAGEEVLSPYAPITAFSPDLLVPTAYAQTEADGQILYEDDAAATIVDTGGDPIGSTKWDGAITASQSTDAERPVWGGGAIGAQFSDSQHLDYDFSKASDDGLTISLIFRVTAGLGDIRYLYNFGRFGINIWARTSTTTSVRTKTEEDGGGKDQRTINKPSGDLSDWTVLSFAMEESGGNQGYTVKVDDGADNAFSFASTGSTLSASSENSLGALADGIQGDVGVEIDMPVAAIWKRRLASTELADVHDAFFGIVGL